MSYLSFEWMIVSFPEVVKVFLFPDC